MKWLRNNGYKTLSLTEAQERARSGNIDEKYVVLTFDDGYRDFYTEAFPVLRQFGFTATIFVTTGRIGNTPNRVEGVDYLTWSDMRTLAASDFEIGSHTVSHPDLRSLGPEEIEYELGSSKETIEDKVGKKVETFSFPFAFPEEDSPFRQYLSDVLASHGYECAVSTIIGRAGKSANRYLLPRIPVNSWDDTSLFRAKLEGGYDWMHWPQWFYKFIHHNVPPMLKSERAEPETSR